MKNDKCAAKVRVLHLVQSPGGVKRYLKAFFTHCNHNLYEHILIASMDYSIDEFKTIVDYFENVNMVREISPIFDIKAIIYVRKIINKYQPDVVYVHSSKAGAIGRIANIGKKNKLIYNPHGWSFNMGKCEIKKKIYALIERFLAIYCCRIICISEAERKSALREKICIEKKLHVINNGIDFEEYKINQKMNRRKIGISDDSFVIGTVGRLTEQKASDFFAYSAIQIKKSIKNAFFLFVGDGELRKEVEECFQKNHLEDSYMITGWVENPFDYVQCFDVATLLSRWEGFGLVLPEYMLAHKPIVATNIDAIPYIIENGKNGLLVSVDNCEEVEKAIYDIYSDEELRKTLIKNGEKSVQQYNIRRVVAEHELLFAQIIEE